MSYILEAIKKADRKRKLGEVPDVHTDHSVIVEEPDKRASWPYVLALLLFINAGVIFWWLAPWKEEGVQKEAQVASSAEVEKSEANTPAEIIDTQKERNDDQEGGTDQSNGEETLASVGVQLEPGLEPDTVSMDTISEDQQDILSEPLKQDQIVEAVDEAEEEFSLAPEQELNIQEGRGTDSETADETAEEGTKEPETSLKDVETEDAILGEDKDTFEDSSSILSEADEFGESGMSDNDTEEEVEEFKIEVFDISKIPFVYQLPSSIQQKLPEIKISFLSYTFRPATRMVRINGRILREGQALTKEIKLERIVPSSVVLVIDKRRFRVDI